MEKIAKKFKEEGGWFIALVGLSPWHYEMEGNLEGYEKALEIVVRECERAKSTGLQCFPLYGFHPADVDKHLGRMKAEEVLEFGMKVMDLIEKACKEGKILGIGEVGRQHYKTTPTAVVIAEMIMNRAMEIAKDLDCVIHLHTEQGGKVLIKDLEWRINKIGIRKEKVIIHHARGVTLEEAVKANFPATCPAIEGSLERASKLEPKYMPESDHIDDPKRPGVVMYPWEIPKSFRKLIERGVISEEYAMKLNVDNVVKYYGVKPP